MITSSFLLIAFINRVYQKPYYNTLQLASSLPKTISGQEKEGTIVITKKRMIAKENRLGSLIFGTFECVSVTNKREKNEVEMIQYSPCIKQL